MNDKPKSRLTQAVSVFWLPLKQQLNITFVIGALVFWYLTRVEWFLLVLLIVEIWYLTLTVRRGPLPMVFYWIKAKIPTRLGQLRWQPLLSWSLLALGILFFIVPAERISFLGYPFKLPYERWEIAALTWNIIFSVISYFLLMPKFMAAWSKTLFPCFLFGGLVCTVAAIDALVKANYSWHLWLVLGVAICYVCADLVICPICVADRARFLKVMLYADMPTVFALAILLKFTNPNRMNNFLSGAIAFQFIANSLIFALIEGGVFETIDNRQDFVVKLRVLNESPDSITT
jgi:hypothetical protein